MDLQNIVIYAIIALVVMYLLPKLGIGRRGGGRSPLNPPGRNPGNRPDNGGDAGGGGGTFPGIGGTGQQPKSRNDSPDTEGDFADRVEGDRPTKST
jgi:hypothetical protein